MAYQIPDAKTQDVDFMFIKLNVVGLEAAVAFYTSVVGLVEMSRVEAMIGGRPVSEVVFMPTYPGGPMFVLAHFHDTTVPAGGELMTGFATRDLDAFIARAVQAGGTVIEPAHDVPQAGMRVAFVADPEGHVLEITQMLG